MSKWPTLPLEAVVSSVERPEIPTPGKPYRQVGVRLWGEGAYERELLDGGETKYKTLSRVEADDIVVNKIWARNGSVAVVPRELAGSYVSGEFPTFKPAADKLEPRWFHWLTKTPTFWEQCDAKSRGTSGKNRIRPERFLEIEIPLPPLPEQRRIVARIESLADKTEEAISLRRQTIEQGEALVNSMGRTVLAAIGEPVTELGQWLDKTREGIQTGPFGAQLSSHEFQDYGVPVLTIGNVQYDGLDMSGLQHVSEEKARYLERYAINSGDILFARMGTVGRCCIVPERAQGWLINYHIIRVALNQTCVEPRFIHWTIRCSKDIDTYLVEKIRGATRQGVNSSIVRALPCRIPGLSKQRRIVAYLDGVQAKVDKLKKMQAGTAAELAALMPSILDKAFKGEF